MSPYGDVGVARVRIRHEKLTKPAIAILALAAMSQVAWAQTGTDKMARPMGKEKTYTGCIEAGASGGSFTLTHVMADMGKGADGMAKETMKKDAMGKGAVAPAPMAISSTAVDLSKHVGHKVAVTGSGAAGSMAKPDAMARPDAMAKSADMEKKMPAFTVESIKMIATTCTM